MMSSVRLRTSAFEIAEGLARAPISEGEGRVEGRVGRPDGDVGREPETRDRFEPAGPRLEPEDGDLGDLGRLPPTTPAHFAATRGREAFRFLAAWRAA